MDKVLKMLTEKLERFGPECAEVPFNHPEEFEKDKYFVELNNIGIQFLNSNRFLDSIEFYKQCINQIETWEKDKGLKVAKGMPFGNLGVSLIVIGKIDEGVSYLLQAYEDDLDYRDAVPLKMQKMYMQFESRNIEEIGGKLFGSSNDGFSSNFADFMNWLEAKGRTFRLSAFSFLSIILENLKILTRHPSSLFSRIRIMSSLRDYVVLLEQILKDIVPHPGMLGQMIYSNNLAPNNNLKLGDSPNEIEFENNIQKVFNYQGINENQRAWLFAYVIRNFVNHNYQIKCPLFFSRIVEILSLILTETPKTILGLKKAP